MESFICTKVSGVNLSAFIYRLFHEDLFSIIGTNTVGCSYMKHENYEACGEKGMEMQVTDIRGTILSRAVFRYCCPDCPSCPVY